MESLREIVSGVELLTFDCYGTLIDWNGGIRAALAQVLAETGAPSRVDLDEVLATYVVTEAAVESEVYRPYRRVLAETLQRLALRFNFPLLPQHRGLLAETLPSWAPFADTGPSLLRLKERFQLGVLSNIDRDLFAGTARHFPVAFDLVVTAEDVRSYKPAHSHFLRGLEWLAKQEGARGRGPGAGGSVAVSHSGERGGKPRGSLLHVAESAYHDGIPTGQLGIPWVWINRTRSTNRHGSMPVAEFDDLAGFVAALG